MSFCGASWTGTPESARTGSAPHQHQDSVEPKWCCRRRSEGSRGDPGGNREVPHRSREQQGDGDRALRASANCEPEEYGAREKDPEGAEHSEIAKRDVDFSRDQPDEPCGDPAGSPLASVPIGVIALMPKPTAKSTSRSCSLAALVCPGYF